MTKEINYIFLRTSGIWKTMNIDCFKNKCLHMMTSDKIVRIDELHYYPTASDVNNSCGENIDQDRK